MEDVLEIYHNELRKCTDKSVTSVLIPSSIKKIGPYAFFECTAIKTVEFGGTVAEWDNVKFKDGLLEYVDVKSVKCSDGVWETPVVLVEDGRMKRCLDKTATSVTIPEGVTYIAAGDFISYARPILSYVRTNSLRALIKTSALLPFRSPAGSFPMAARGIVVYRLSASF